MSVLADRHAAYASPVARVRGSIDFDRVADCYDQTRGGEERGRVLASELERWLPPEGLTLEVGVGTGVVASALQARGRAVVGMDLSPRMLALAKARLGPVVAVADAHALPIPLAAVDNICVVWVLHAVADAGAVIRECQRVLRVGGRLVVASGRPRSGDDDLSAVDRPLTELRPGEDDRDTVLSHADAAGLALIEVAEVANEFEQSPAELVRRIEERVFAFLWEVDDHTWARVVRPVIDGLRRLPEPDRPRRRVHRHDLLVFEQAARS